MTSTTITVNDSGNSNYSSDGSTTNDSSNKRTTNNEHLFHAVSVAAVGPDTHRHKKERALASIFNKRSPCIFLKPRQ